MGSSFPRFTQLPTELRLQIWQAACSHPIHKYEAGLQYVDIQDGEAKVPTPQSSSQLSLGKMNRSAYLIDSGLWKACKESQMILKKHIELCKGLRIREWTLVGPPGRSSERYRIYPIDENRYHLPAPILSSEVNEPCLMLANPVLDVFCIRVDDWLAIQDGRLFFPRITLSTLPIKPRGGQCEWWAPNSIDNIALEYHDNWVKELPDLFFSLCSEKSARGYLAYLLKKRLADGVRRNGRGLFFIDKNVKWFAGPDNPDEWLYRDCDAEYIEINWYQVARPYNLLDEERVDAAAFIHRLDRFCCRTRDEYPWGKMTRKPQPWLMPHGPPLKSIVRLLILLKNQVKRITQGCKAKFRKVRWCVCDEE